MNLHLRMAWLGCSWVVCYAAMKGIADWPAVGAMMLGSLVVGEDP